MHQFAKLLAGFTRLFGLLLLGFIEFGHVVSPTAEPSCERAALFP